MYVFTHHDRNTSIVWSLSNRTKVLIGSAMTIVVATVSLNLLGDDWSQGVKYALTIDVFVIVCWPVLFFKARQIFWFQRAYADGHQKWYNAFLLSERNTPYAKESILFYFWPLVFVTACALAARYWYMAQIIVITFLALFIVWAIYMTVKDPILSAVFMIKNFDRVMNDYFVSSHEINELKAECDTLKRSVEEHHSTMIQEASKVARLLIEVKMLVEASKEEGIKSKHLAEARRLIKITIEKLPLNHDQLDLIELQVCRELGRAPEKRTPAVTAS